MSLTVGSLFSGAGGFDLGFERAGFAVRWQVEIDRHAVAVLARHWPTVARYGDVRTVRGDAVAPVDVVIGGFPCQDVSVAGRRAGLAGARTGLFWEAVRIVEEMRDATGGRYPALVVLENVVGLFSSRRGRDFAAVLGGLRQCGALDLGWRVLDSLGVGDCALHRDEPGRRAVPQRRRRVFLVADFGGERAAEVLALADGLSGHPAAGRTAGQGAAAGARGGAAPGGGAVAFGGNNRSGPIDAATTLTAHGGSHGRLDFDSETFVVERRVAPFDERQVTSPDNRSTVAFDAPAPTLNGGSGLSAVLTYAPETAASVQASAGHHGHSSPRGDGADTLVMQAFNWQAGATATLRVTDGAGGLGCLTASQAPAVAIAWQESQSGTGARGDAYGTLDANDGPRRHEGVLIDDGVRYVIRRLTPRECERLMALPDDWTRWGADGRELADGPRYRLCGNAVVVTVAAWLAERARAALLPAERSAELSEAAG